MIFLRACLFNLYFYALTALLALAGVAVRLFARERAYDLACLWVRLVLAGLRRLCAVEIQVSGLKNLPANGAMLLASQHQSAFDTLVWLSLLPSASYVVKRELVWIPLFGPLLRPAGMIPVDRSAGASGLRRLIAAARAARDAGRQIVIFPEGTRVAPGARVKLHPGIAAIAGQLDLPVIPVATDSGLCWQRRAFLKYPGTIHVAIGAPIAAGLPRADLLAAIEAWWRDAEAAGYPVDNSVENI